MTISLLFCFYVFTDLLQLQWQKMSVINPTHIAITFHFPRGRLVGLFSRTIVVGGDDDNAVDVLVVVDCENVWCGCSSASAICCPYCVFSSLPMLYETILVQSILVLVMGN